MTDAFNKLKDQKALREKYINQGVADYARAVERRDRLLRTLEFYISDAEGLTIAKEELRLVLEALNECVPAQLRIEYEARAASRTEEITGGVM